MRIKRVLFFITLNSVLCYAAYSQNVTQKKEELNNYIKTSVNFAAEKEFDSANIYSKKAFLLSKKIGNAELIAKTIHNNAKILYWQAHTLQAKTLLKKNIENNSLNDSIVIRSLALLGEILRYEESDSEALKKYIKIEKITNMYPVFRSQDSAVMSFVYTQMGSIHQKENNVSQAINYYDKALLYCNNDSKCINMVMYFKSIIYDKKNSIRETINHSLEGIAISIKNNYEIYLPSYYLFLSNSYLKLKKGDSAIYYGNKGLYDNIHCRRELLFNNIGKGYVLKKDYKQSISYFEKALDHSSEKQSVEFYKNIRDSYILLKDYKKAVFYNKKHLTFKNTIDSLQIRQQLLEITEKHNSEKHKLEIKMLQSENKRKNNQIALICSSLMLLSIFLGYIIFSYIKQKKQKNLLFLKNRQLAQKLKNNEIKLTIGNKPKNIESSNIDLIQKEKIKTFINKAIQEEFYLDKNISLVLLAKLANTNTTYLSKVINDDYQKSFALFINELRISNTLKKLEIVPDYKNLTIENIGDKAGFSSNSAFYNAFKKFTGLTPSYYIKKRLLQENN